MLNRSVRNLRSLSANAGQIWAQSGRSCFSECREPVLREARQYSTNLLRSVLYTPGARKQALQKSRTLDCDAFIFDLEDAVAPAAKDTARQNVLEEIKAGGFGSRHIAVRINGRDTPWFEEDLRCVSDSGAKVVVLPKVDSVELIQETCHVLKRFNASEDIRLWLTIESPKGVLHCNELAQADSRIEALVLGTSDLSKELRCKTTPNRHALLPSMGLVLLAARANGLVALDGVHLDLEDSRGFEAAAQLAKEMGYDGKTLIHPKTVDITNKIFSPSNEEVESARKIIDAYTKALALGQGIVVVDGKLIENLHIQEAQRLVDMDEMLKKRDPQS